MNDEPNKPPARPRIRIRLHREEEVGYGKPPRAHQFKPGQSGNPKGRKKGVKNEATIMHELLQHKVTLTERGKARQVTLLEAILRKLVEDCLKGNIRSTAFLLNRFQASSMGEGSQTNISEDDNAVLEAYIKEFQPKNDGGAS
ncbi:hypothetical protein BN961_00334 [Afipia felis]|uniref:DUF5681 domain-containing protein n=1 Tax=Afipia felis TaxID=1035 RepID=A0A090N6J3_AFIFE|nr:DUF5681 domain-containing protein [Afipia felis]CEG06953.1 hypothetical protein BN961_00334 [Afipia felis]